MTKVKLQSENLRFVRQELSSKITKQASSGLQHSLWRLEITMYDFMEMEIIHPTGDSRGPVHEQPRRDLPTSSQDLIQLSVGTVLHDDAVTRGLSADAPSERAHASHETDRQTRIHSYVCGAGPRLTQMTSKLMQTTVLDS